MDQQATTRKEQGAWERGPAEPPNPKEQKEHRAEERGPAAEIGPEERPFPLKQEDQSSEEE